MRGVLADTVPLYAAYDSSDRYHDRSQHELIVFSQQPLPVIVIYPVLTECHNLLLKRFGVGVGKVTIAGKLSDDVRKGTLTSILKQAGLK